MTDEAPLTEDLKDDPEVAALLNFTPVVRKCIRHDGWMPDKQRDFIRALTVLGNAEAAAIAVGGTMSGAYKLRTAAGGREFAAAWDAALTLYFDRHPRPEPKGRPSRGEILSGGGRKPWPAAPTRHDPGPVDPEAEERAKEEGLDLILEKYLVKLSMERVARLEGRIVEADYYVRQLTWLEVVLDLGDRGAELLQQLRRGGLAARDIAATPMSVLLDQARRLYWREEGGPERPPMPELGESEGEVSPGPRLECQYDRERDGPDYQAGRRRQEERQALAAEAQAAWEEKARREAEAWRRRVEEEGGEAPP
jgi:hypothetical protein